MTSGGSFGASSLEQEIGLGRAERIISLEIFWPTSGTHQVFSEIPLDTRIVIREGAAKYDQTGDTLSFSFGLDP